LAFSALKSPSGPSSLSRAVRWERELIPAIPSGLLALPIRYPA
jgi:hypothetical protein